MKGFGLRGVGVLGLGFGGLGFRVLGFREDFVPCEMTGLMVLGALSWLKSYTCLTDPNFQVRRWSMIGTLTKPAE